MLPLVKQYFLKQSKLWDIYVVLGLALLFFWLQARHLHNAALPVSDEGEHVDAGRRMFEGYLPYKDFYYQHPPFFALFLGASLRLFGGMFPVRVLFLFLNVFSVLPLYAVLKKIGGHRTAGIIAITFYLTYHQMVAHDFRFAAIRQFANICFIGFLYWGIVKHEERYSIYAQGAFAILTTMTLLPMAFNLFFASLACIFTEAAAKRPTVFWRYLGIGIGAAVVLSFLFLIPHSLDRLILFHLHGGIDNIPKRLQLLPQWSGRNTLFYCLSIGSLLFSILLIPRIRIYAFMMICMIVMALIPREFLRHYVVIAAVPFTFGLMTFTLLIIDIVPRRLIVVAYMLCCAALIMQLSIVLPSLLNEWSQRNPTYYSSVALIKTCPEPILTFTQPIYAIEAGRAIVQDYYCSSRIIVTRHGVHLSAEYIEKLAERSCSIVLTGWDQSVVPAAVQSHWAEKYAVVDNPYGLRIFLTNNRGCS